MILIKHSFREYEYVHISLYCVVFFINILILFIFKFILKTFL